MIKECYVISFNKFTNVIVVDFDGKQVQFNINKEINENKIFVKLENGNYKIVSKEEFEKSKIAFKKKENIYDKRKEEK